MWWREKWCERCNEQISADENRVEVSGVPYHFKCYPMAANGDVTRFIRVKPETYRVEFLEPEAPLLDWTVDRLRVEKTLGTTAAQEHGRRMLQLF